MCLWSGTDREREEFEREEADVFLTLAEILRRELCKVEGIVVGRP